MALLKEQDRAALRETFAEMTGRVRVAFFAQALGCETCGIVEQILDEVAPLGDKIELVKYNYAIDREQVAKYGIQRIPAIALTRLESSTDEESSPVERDYGIRFYGVPSGYEFMTLIGGILDVSSGESHLSDESRQLVAQLTEPTHIQVFTTPT
jgi:alkyl hydroperoxide reductase subunit AhpF